MMSDLVTVAEPKVRRRVVVRGIVQGVGFRPFVWRLASELALAGWVRNDARGVTIEVEGERSRIDRMVRRLTADSPARARVDSVVVESCALAQAGLGFAILESGAGRVATAIGPDGAICAECLDDLFDPTGRRYRYAFTNCTHCGPRYTIARELPYDRATTSMAAFQQCPDCLAEYTSPADRRFHAEPNACPACGPRLSLHAASGAAERDADPISSTLSRIRRGEIVAIKGLGGFHLACDARNADAVARLRERKAREEKPFAVMVSGVSAVADFAQMSSGERALLESLERPIVLLRKTSAADGALAGVAPGLAWLGVMLPYTPIALSAVPRSRRPAGRHRMDRWRHRPRAGHDEREPRRRAPRDAQRGGVCAALRHRRRVPAARPQHRHALRRQRAPRNRRGIGRAVPVRPSRARLHAARDPAGPAGAVGRRAGGPFQEHRLRDARRRGVRLAARGRPRQRADRERARRHRRAPGVDPRDRARGRRARPACRLSSARAMRRGSLPAGACRCAASSTTTRTSPRWWPSIA